MDRNDELIFATQEQLELFDKIRGDLTNFPPELIYHWLLPFADVDELGWPPPEGDCNEARESRWHRILKYGVGNWRRVTWELQELDANTIPFTDEGLRGFRDLALHGLDRPTVLGAFMGESSKRRFWQQTKIILDSGSFAQPPALLWVDDRLECVDGNHRLSALSLVLSDPGVRATHERMGWESVPLAEVHQFWVGTLPPPENPPA